MKSKKGFTMIEVLASISISLIILLVMSGFFISSTHINKITTENLEIQNDYRQLYNGIRKYFKYPNQIIEVNEFLYPQESFEGVKGYFEINTKDGYVLIGGVENNGKTTMYEFNDIHKIKYRGNLYFEYNEKNQISKNITYFNYKNIGNNLIQFNVTIEENNMKENFSFLLNKNTNYIINATVKNK